MISNPVSYTVHGFKPIEFVVNLISSWKLTLIVAWRFRRLASTVAFIFSLVTGEYVVRKSPYSKAELNKLIDSVIHPLAKEDPSLLILDGFLHSLVEQNPPLSVRKFLRYNLPRLVASLKKHKKGES